ncbi:hypothetical protein A6X21_13680 [Planctopirus hydrillae]|uniref:Uncharacterized protein n=1 Tax=Planctopirus hydrillae TaxID=1841610 RepID=A0A1C3E3W7_9PLAN|nr:hypothetical protein A6X21_13680 [Planctopirus hydrillae]
MAKLIMKFGPLMMKSGQHGIQARMKYRSPTNLPQSYEENRRAHKLIVRGLTVNSLIDSTAINRHRVSESSPEIDHSLGSSGKPERKIDEKFRCDYTGQSSTLALSNIRAKQWEV